MTVQELYGHLCTLKDCVDKLAIRIGNEFQRIFNLLGNVNSAIGDRLVSGGVGWLQDYDFEVTNLTYFMQGVLLSSPGGFFTLAPSDPTLDRYDLSYVDIDGNIGVKQGTYATPELVTAPLLDDPSTQLLLCIHYVKAGSTQPDGTSTELVYDENAGSPAEWDGIITEGTGDLGALILPYLNVTHGELSASETIDHSVTFIADAPLLFVDFDFMHMYLAIAQALTDETNRIIITLYDGATETGNFVLLPDLFGWDTTVFNEYQSVIIPKSFFEGITQTQFDTVKITSTKLTSKLLFDDINFVKGTATLNNTNTFLDLIDTFNSYVGKSLKPLRVNAIENGIEVFDPNDLVKLNTANLIIGGVGATINTPALLASKFSFTENDVDFFRVVGDDVYAIINIEYDLDSDNAFDSLTVTFIKEKENLKNITGFSAFGNVSTLTKVELLGLEEISGNLCFDSCSNLKSDDIIVPNLKILSSSSVFGRLSSASDILWLPRVHTISGTSAIYSLQGKVYLPELVNLTGINNFTSISTTNNFSEIYIPKVNTALPSNTFILIQGNPVITVGSILETINSGNPDPLLISAEGAGATIQYDMGKDDISIQDANEIEQFKITNKIQFEGATLDASNKRVILPPTSYRTYYLDSVNGNDSTGTPDFANLPFQTLDGAITHYKANTDTTTLEIQVATKFVFQNNAQYTVTQNIDIFVDTNFERYIIVFESLYNTKIVFDSTGGPFDFCGNINLLGKFIFDMPLGELSTTGTNLIRLFDYNTNASKTPYWIIQGRLHKVTLNENHEFGGLHSTTDATGMYPLGESELYIAKLVHNSTAWAFRGIIGDLETSIVNLHIGHLDGNNANNNLTEVGNNCTVKIDYADLDVNKFKILNNALNSGAKVYLGDVVSTGGGEWSVLSTNGIYHVYLKPGGVFQAPNAVGILASFNASPKFYLYGNLYTFDVTQLWNDTNSRTAEFHISVNTLIITGRWQPTVASAGGVSGSRNAQQLFVYNSFIECQDAGTEIVNGNAYQLYTDGQITATFKGQCYLLLPNVTNGNAVIKDDNPPTNSNNTVVIDGELKITQGVIDSPTTIILTQTANVTTY